MKTVKNIFDAIQARTDNEVMETILQEPGFRRAKDKAWENTMANYLKFADPSYDEFSSPMG